MYDPYQRTIERGCPEHVDGQAKAININLQNTLTIQNQLSCVYYVFIVYYQLRDDVQENRNDSFIYLILFMSSFLLLAGCLISKIPMKTFLRYYSAIFMYTFIFTPVFYTLTQSISSDTIFRLQVGLLAAHLISLDYFDDSGNVSIFSTNTATFAVICMVSRLQIDDEFTDGLENGKVKSYLKMNDHAYFKSFAMIMIAIQLLLVWPMLRSKLNGNARTVINLVMISLALEKSYKFTKIAFYSFMFLNCTILTASYALKFYANKVRDTSSKLKLNSTPLPKLFSQL